MSEKLDKKSRKLVSVILGGTAVECRPMTRSKLVLLIRNVMDHVAEDNMEITINDLKPGEYAKQLAKRIIK